VELNAQGYLNFLRLHLNVKDYGKSPLKNGEITLREKIFGKTGDKPKEYRVKLKVDGDILVIKLDAKIRGKSLPLFHFLDDNGKPWSKRCDFVIFNARDDDLFVYCLEFKSESIPHDVQYQLKASSDWLRSLHAIVGSYTTKKTVMKLTRYVVSNTINLQGLLDAQEKYLQRDHTIRHYRYADLNGMALADLENSNIEVIR
jgi:hypothetical protein